MNEYMRKWREIGQQIEETPEYKRDAIITDFVVEVYRVMKEKGVKRIDLAKRLGVNRSYVTQLLSGSANMTIDTLIKVAQSLDMNVKIELNPDTAEISYKSNKETMFAYAAEEAPNYPSVTFQKERGTFSGTNMSLLDANESMLPAHEENQTAIEDCCVEAN